jgi:hypothetical protein
MTDDSSTRGVGFWVGVVIGGALVTWGALLFLQDTPRGDHRLNFVGFLVGSDLLHDLLVAPFICLVGVVGARSAPRWAKAPVQAGLIATGTVVLIAWLPWAGTADGVGNPTIQPLDYTTATLSVLAFVWLAAGAWAASRRLR